CLGAPANNASIAAVACVEALEAADDAANPAVSLVVGAPVFASDWGEVGVTDWGLMLPAATTTLAFAPGPAKTLGPFFLLTCCCKVGEVLARKLALPAY